MCDQVLSLPTWNQHKISPTYLSTNLMTPLQIPFRDTVPRSHIIAEGTGRRFPRLEWGSFMVDYGGIGKLSFLGKTKNQYRELLLPRSHRHYLSSCGKMIHGVVQPSKITCLLKSKLRQNDEFIVQPCRCKERAMMKEENHFIQEPSYSSHRSRNAMFPRSRAQHDSLDPVKPHDFRLKTPLSDITRNELEGVVHRRYKISSCANDYQQPYPVSACTKNTDTEDNILQQNCDQQNYYTSNRCSGEICCDNCKITGLWPCWPAGNNYIVSNVTGQIVEKRDVKSLDDLRDYRTYIMNSDSPTKQVHELKEDSTTNKFKSFAGPDFVPLPCVDIYGCGPGKVGGGNMDKEIPLKTKRSIPTEHKQCHRSNKKLDDHHQPKDHRKLGKNTPSPPKPFKNRHERHFNNILGCWDRNFISKAINLSRIGDEKMARLTERISSHVCPDNENHENENSYEEFDEDMFTETETNTSEKKTDLMIQPKHVLFCDTSETKFVKPKGLPNDVKNLFYTKATDEQGDHDSPVRDGGSVVSLELHRDTETVSNLLASINEAEKRSAAKTPIPCITQPDGELLDPTKDPTSVFYRPPIKLPPEPLWTTLPYDGDRIPDRLGVRFKTVALKRYHAIHPETIPDLRDFRPPLRRSKFLGYHTSVFR